MITRQVHVYGNDGPHKLVMRDTGAGVEFCLHKRTSTEPEVWEQEWAVEIPSKSHLEISKVLGTLARVWEQRRDDEIAKRASK